MLNDSSINIFDPEVSPTECSQGAPFATEFIKVSRQDMIQLKADRNRYKNLHEPIPSPTAICRVDNR